MTNLTYKKTSRVFTENTVVFKGKFNSIPETAINELEKLVIDTVEGDSKEKYSITKWEVADSDFTLEMSIPTEIPESNVKVNLSYDNTHSFNITLPKKERTNIGTVEEEETTVVPEEDKGEDTGSHDTVGEPPVQPPVEAPEGDQSSQEGQEEPGSTNSGEEGSQESPQGETEGHTSPTPEERGDSSQDTEQDSNTASDTETHEDDQEINRGKDPILKKNSRGHYIIPINDLGDFKVQNVVYRKVEKTRSIETLEGGYTYSFEGLLMNRVGSKMIMTVHAVIGNDFKNYDLEIIGAPECFHEHFDIHYNSYTDEFTFTCVKACEEFLFNEGHIRFQLIRTETDKIVREGIIRVCVYDSSLQIPKLVTNVGVQPDEHGVYKFNIQKHKNSANLILPTTVDFNVVEEIFFRGIPQSEYEKPCRIMVLNVPEKRRNRYISIINITPIQRGTFYIHYRIRSKSGAMEEIKIPIGIEGENPPNAGLSPEEYSEAQVFGGTKEEREKWLSYQSLRRFSTFDVKAGMVNYKTGEMLDMGMSFTSRDKYAMFWVLKNAFMKYPNIMFRECSKDILITNKSFLQFLKDWRSKDPNEELYIYPPYAKTVNDWRR